MIPKDHPWWEWREEWTQWVFELALDKMVWARRREWRSYLDGPDDEDTGDEDTGDEDTGLVVYKEGELAVVGMDDVGAIEDTRPGISSQSSLGEMLGEQFYNIMAEVHAVFDPVLAFEKRDRGMRAASAMIERENPGYALAYYDAGAHCLYYQQRTYTDQWYAVMAAWGIHAPIDPVTNKPSVSVSKGISSQFKRLKGKFLKESGFETVSHRDSANGGRTKVYDSLIYGDEDGFKEMLDSNWAAFGRAVASEDRRKRDDWMKKIIDGGPR